MTAPPERRGSFTIALTGDVMLGRLVANVIDQKGYAYVWGDVLPRLRAADARLINLECALTQETQEAPNGAWKEFHFRAGPSAVETLRAAGIDFSSLANNHAGDFGSRGLLETIGALDGAGIRHAGAGATCEDAARPALLTTHGWRVAVLAFADYPREWAATADRPGINYARISTEPERFAPVRASIAAARAQADFLVCSLHWGPNMRERPTPAFRGYARAVIEAGADVFWGHSAHVVQGVEIWHGKPILYDTGDFVDDYAVDPWLRNDLSALFVLEVLPPDVLRLELLPVAIDEMHVSCAKGDERAWFIDRFTQRCAEMGTQTELVNERIAVRIPREVRSR